MAYYCQVTTVTRSRPTGLTVAYELRDDATTPNPVVDTGSIGLTFDMRLLDGSVPASERRRFIIDQLEQAFRAHIDQVRAGDAAFTAIQSALVGRRYPVA